MVLFPQDNSSRLLILKKVLYHPLAGLALGLHLLLLIVPFNPSNPAPAESEKLPEEEAVIPVDILNLADISAPKPLPPASAESAPTQPASQPPNQTPSQPQIQTQPSATQQAAPPLTSSAIPNNPSNPALANNQPPTNNQSPANNQPPNNQPPANQPPAYDPGLQRAAFIGSLGNIGLNNYGDRLPQPNFFKRPENAGYFLTSTDPPALVGGTLSSTWMDKGISTIFPQLQTTYATTGVNFTQLEDYGGEVLYELTDATGQPFQYISLIELKGSTLIVNWPERPQ